MLFVSIISHAGYNIVFSQLYERYVPGYLVGSEVTRQSHIRHPCQTEATSLCSYTYGGHLSSTFLIPRRMMNLVSFLYLRFNQLVFSGIRIFISHSQNALHGVIKSASIICSHGNVWYTLDTRRQGRPSTKRYNGISNVHHNKILFLRRIVGILGY